MREKSQTITDRFDEFEDTHVRSGSSGRPISGILQDIVTHMTEIIRSEIRLARAEIRQDVTQVTRAGIFLGVGAVLALYGFGFILLAGVYALSNVISPWISALIVGGGMALLAGAFFFIGRKKMQLASLKPDETIQSLKENVTWVKKQTR